MKMPQNGGCLCGSVRYTVTAEPVRVTMCHCKFCQKTTGSAYLVEPIFRRQDVSFTGAMRTFVHRSENSGKKVTVNFCGTCATKIYLDLERFPTIWGLFGGTFDDPNWFDRAASNCFHIFTGAAQRGVVLPAGVATFEAHAIELDGTPARPTVLAHPTAISKPTVSNARSSE
jgi:hypothetical protein